jgi:hypothetical protein
MSARKDLTRWNRAGLSRFDYVDGNAVVYLEFLRRQLAEKFPGIEWLEPGEAIPADEIPVAGETLLEEQQRQHLIARRLLESYHQDRRDWGWEMSRTFARACHILTGYAEAYANEGTLGTATQWENLRRLVELLDYHPAPPASATSQLVIMAKTAGLVRKGFQVKNSPLFGAQKLIFETLEDLQVDPALNMLRPAGWDQSEEPALPGVEGGPAAERQFSELANEAVISLQGVGPVWRGILDPASGPEPAFRVARIRDFLDLDPKSAAFAAIGETILRELKAKANLICSFNPGPGWEAVAGLPLPELAAKDPSLLAAQTGKTEEEVKNLQQQIELLGACLDQGVYQRTTLSGVLSPAPVVSASAVQSLWRAPQKPKVLPGQVAMVFHQAQKSGEAVTIARVDDKSGAIDLRPSPVQFSWHHWPKGQARLLVAPRWQRECWLNGPDVIRTLEPHGIKAGAFICWKDAGIWRFAEVTETDTRNLRLNAKGPFPKTGVPVHEGRPLESQVMATTLEAVGLVGGGDPQLEHGSLPDLPEPKFKMKDPVPNPPDAPPLLPPGSLSFGSFLFPTPLLPMDLVKAAVDLLLSLGVMIIPTTGEVVFKSLPGVELPTVNDLFALLDGKVDWVEGLDSVAQQKAALAELLKAPVGAPIPLFQKILDNLQEKGPLIAVPKNPPVKAIVAAADPLYMFDGTTAKLSGDWVVGAFSDGLRALKVGAVKTFVASDQAESFSLSFENLAGAVGELQSVYADFRAELSAEGAGVNTAPVDPAQLELAESPASLIEGLKVLLSAEGQDPVVARVTSVKGNRITTLPPASGFTKGNLVIYANVVDIGHGESKAAKILGSGNAAKSNQEFTLEVEGVAFTPDASMSSGVAAAIEVNVGGRIWEQVATLKNSAADDHHYAIRMTEEGFVKLLFGDGRHGRRLPTGRNNLQVRYRVGSGLIGNLPARSFEKAVNPHPLVEALLQPLPSAGGGNMEESSSLRENAPPSLLTLERAVSVSDFADLATGRSNIWQARAQREIGQAGALERVRVTLVPADGVSSPQILGDVRLFLQSHALPGVQVEVEAFTADTDFALKVLLRIRSAEFVAAAVVRDVTAALRARFCLKRSNLGAAFYLSEVYRVVEQIAGVENSICSLLRQGEQVQVIKAAATNRVIYLDPARLAVDQEEYRP